MAIAAELSILWGDFVESSKYLYQLSMTDEQAKVVERALEFYTRIRNGQFKELLWELRDLRPFDSTNQWDMESLAFMLRGLLFPELGRDRGASYGVGHDHKADVAWDVYQTVRHTRSWHEHPEGGIGVNFDTPLHTSSEPLPECRVIEGKGDFRNGYIL